MLRTIRRHQAVKALLAAHLIIPGVAVEDMKETTVSFPISQQIVQQAVAVFDKAAIVQ